MSERDIIKAIERSSRPEPDLVEKIVGLQAAIDGIEDFLDDLSDWIFDDDDEC